MVTPVNPVPRKPKKKRPSQATHKTQASSNLATSHEVMNVMTIPSPPGLHRNNRHQGLYDFAALSNVVPELKTYMVKNPRDQWTIPFNEPHAVLLLNQALLAHHYGVNHWQIPPGYLCPPIPGRADYIHRAAELLFTDCPELSSQAITMLDVGTGANAIYPIIAATEYNWTVVGSDIDPLSVKCAKGIVKNNACLKGKVTVRLQTEPNAMFAGIIGPEERYTLTTCNPPFHASAHEAAQGSQRKLDNLGKNKQKRGRSLGSQQNTHTNGPMLNFGGQHGELWCVGGEASFLRRLAQDSAQFSEQVLWFTSLISKKDNVRWMKKQLAKVGACDVKIVEMAQGQKISRFIAWSFQNAAQRNKWGQEAC